MNQPDLIYQELEAKIPKYADLINIPIVSNNEPMVPIEVTANLAYKQIGQDMRPYTGRRIYVRQTVAEKLIQASRALALINPELRLQVVYGYRALSIQTSLFDQIKADLQPKFRDPIELMEAIHRSIAVPTVAGHPTGAAVDIQIIKAGRPIDFGTDIWQFSRDSYVFSPFISDRAKANRMMLRRVMLGVGFASYDSEWWHFSYGDQEWASYYDQPYATYEQLDFRSVHD